MAEAKLIHSFQSHYSTLWSGQQLGDAGSLAATG
jgi:hypothetical protein